MSDTTVALSDDYAPDCQVRNCDDCRAEDCVCGCHLDDGPDPLVVGRMILYHVTRNDGWGYDEYDELVVRAASVADVRQIVAEGHYAGFKTDGSNMIIVEIDPDGPSDVISASFVQG